MTIVNPCCCVTLQKGSKIVAVIDIILASIPLIIFLTNYLPDTVGLEGKPFTDFNTGIWTIFIVFLCANIGLSMLLLLGAKDRCTKKLKAWFYIRIVTTGLTVLIIIISACFEISMKLILFDFFYTIYRLFTLWVIYVFIGEIMYEQIFYTKKSNEFPSPGNTLPSKTISSKFDGFDNPGGDSYGYGTVNGAYIP